MHFQSNNSLQYTELCLFSNISFPETSEFDTSDTFISRTVVTSLSPASSNLRDLATLLHPRDTPSRTSDRRSEQSQAWCPWGLGSYPPSTSPISSSLQYLGTFFSVLKSRKFHWSELDFYRLPLKETWLILYINKTGVKKKKKSVHKFIFVGFFWLERGAYCYNLIYCLFS